MFTRHPHFFFQKQNQKFIFQLILADNVNMSRGSGMQIYVLFRFPGIHTPSFEGVFADIYDMFREEFSLNPVSVPGRQG
jgi:hypothetical protein